MTIKYGAPLERGWERMVHLLFRPFNLIVWIVLGFACWLSRLATGGGIPSGGFNVPSDGDFDDAPFGALSRAGDADVWSTLGWVLPLVGCIVLFAVALILVCLWVGARGQMIFLSNVARCEVAIVAPWKEFRREGNSLFRWHLLFIVISLATMLLAALPGLLVLLPAIDGGDEVGPLVVTGIFLLLILIVPAIFLLAFVKTLFNDFVVAVMYHRRLQVTAAWKVFWPLLRQHFGSFVLYGLMLLGLHILVGSAVAILILATCCVLLVPLIFPFVGTVLMLPIYVTFRAFSLEFLAQMGPEWDALKRAEVPAVSPPASPAGQEQGGGNTESPPEPAR